MTVLLEYDRFTELLTFLRDVHQRHFARGEVYDQRSGPRKPLAGAGVGGSYSSGERVSGLVYPGCGTRAQPMRISYVVPNSAKQCQIVPNSA